MPATAGLEFWEIVAVSAMCAVAILSFASILGATVAHFVLREPKAVRRPAEARGEVPAGAPPVHVGRASPVM